MWEKMYVSQQNSPEEFGELLQNTIPFIKNVCRRHANLQDIDDVCNEVLIKIIKQFKDWRRESYFGWVKQIAKNTAINHGLRTKKFAGFGENGEKDIADRKALDPAVDTAEKEEMHRGHLAVQKFLESRQGHAKYTTLQRYLTGNQTYDEIAEADHISLGTVKSRTGYGMKQLEKYLRRVFPDSSPSR